MGSSIVSSSIVGSTIMGMSSNGSSSRISYLGRTHGNMTLLLYTSIYRDFSYIIFNSFFYSFLRYIVDSFLGNIISSLNRYIFYISYRYLINIFIIFYSGDIFSLVFNYTLIYISFFNRNHFIIDSFSFNWVSFDSASCNITL